MEHIIIGLVYDFLRKWFKWLPDPATQEGRKKQRKVLLLGIWILFLMVLLGLLSIKPPKPDDFGYVSGKIEHAEFNRRTEYGTTHLNANFELEGMPISYRYYFERDEIDGRIKIKVGDSVKVGLRKNRIENKEGGIVEEIITENGTLGGIQRIIDTQIRFRKRMTPVLLAAISMTAFFILRSKNRSKRVPLKG